MGTTLGSRSHKTVSLYTFVSTNRNNKHLNQSIYHENKRNESGNRKYKKTSNPQKPFANNPPDCICFSINIICCAARFCALRFVRWAGN